MPTLACRLERAAADAIWPALLACREHLQRAAGDASDRIYFAERDGGWRFATAPGAGAGACLAVPLVPGTDDEPFTVVSEAEPEADARAIFRLYLPILIGAHAARRRGAAFVTAHVAQTLDGRIACRNGQSQWISNHANLVHAHRLRALHDAVLIGSRTVELDDPRLTVRHVAGRNPRPVILSASGRVMALAGERHLFHNGTTVICAAGAAAARVPGVHDRLDVIQVQTGAGERIAAATIGEVLATRGHHALFLEGGAATVSGFLAEGAIDVLHVHVAPRILGSGIPSFSLPEVHSVQEARAFRVQHFEMDGEMLFACHEV